MTVAEELRKDADLAIKEGGMYYSGEYLDAIARRAEAEQAENAKLRELVRDALRPKYDDTLRMPPAKWREYDADVLRRARELGIEVDV